MSTLRTRVQRLERVAGPHDGTDEVWYQRTDGTDAFMSPQHEGVTLTEAQLDALPHTGRRIVVHYVEARPDPRPDPRPW